MDADLAKRVAITEASERGGDGFNCVATIHGALFSQLCSKDLPSFTTEDGEFDPSIEISIDFRPDSRGLCAAREIVAIRGALVAVTVFLTGDKRRMAGYVEADVARRHPPAPMTPRLDILAERGPEGLDGPMN